MYVKRWFRRYRGEIRVITTLIVIFLLFNIYQILRTNFTSVDGSTLSTYTEKDITAIPTQDIKNPLVIPTNVQINIYINNTSPIYNQIYYELLTQIPSMYPTQIVEIPSSPIPTATLIPTIQHTTSPTFSPTLTSTPIPTPTNAPLLSSFSAKYFNNLTLSGQPVLSRVDETIQFDWVKDSPHSSIVKDEFSVRWEGKINATQGDYKIKISHDDGMRISIDGNIIYDSWKNQGAYPKSLNITLTSGLHPVIIEYYDKAYEAVAFFEVEKL